MVEACMTAADMSRTEQWLEVFNDYMQRHQHPPLLTFCSVCEAESQVNEGRWSEAEHTLQTALAALDESVRPSRCIHPASLLSSIRIDQSRFEEADHLMSGLEDLPEMALPLAELHLAREEPSVAAAVLRRRLNVIGTGTILASPLLSSLAQVEIARGDLEAASDAVSLLRAIAETSDRPQDEAMAHLAAGRLARVEEATDARDHLERALEVFGTSSLPLQAARTRLELAFLARVSGDDALAIDEARIALSAFEEIGAVRDADMAARLLRDLGASGRSGVKGLQTLTGREREVLALLGQGLTNAEIAARLFISTKTAGHHVSNILAKLGLRNRAEAGAYAQRFLTT
jgi:DNA-binding CsgD family transcriptional regulator